MKPYSRNPHQKGGTLIAEDVHDLEEHQRRLLDLDYYRPKECPRCKHGVLHVHDYRFRIPRDLPGRTSVTVCRYVCASASCGACWQILPAFLARHLQRTWSAIECVAIVSRESASPSPSCRSSAPPVPTTTTRRYRFRLACCAAALRAAFAAAGAEIESAFGHSLGPLTRAAFCEALAEACLLPLTRRLASLAEWIHRLVRGLRLM
jgi:hypothetical protein